MINNREYIRDEETFNFFIYQIGDIWRIQNKDNKFNTLLDLNHLKNMKCKGILTRTIANQFMTSEFKRKLGLELTNLDNHFLNLFSDYKDKIIFNWLENGERKEI
jgi:hypothetical protein